MKIEEVPQDKSAHRGTEELKKVVYATNENGEYTAVGSIGWEPENIALKQAWDDIDITLKETEAAVLAGKISPIAYFMEKKLMDVALLARYVDKWKWTVRRHMKPSVFAKLSERTLSSYAQVFEISTKELKTFGK